MTPFRRINATVLALALLAGLGATVLSETVGTDTKPALTASTFLIDDAIADAQTPRKVKAIRPEQRKTRKSGHTSLRCTSCLCHYTISFSDCELTLKHGMRIVNRSATTSRQTRCVRLRNTTDDE